MLELRDEVSELKTDKMRREAQISQLELVLGQKSDDIMLLEDHVKKVSQRSNKGHISDLVSDMISDIDNVFKST